ncbi:U3 small nucleolar RNA-associated protein [Histoplasma capsulatum var. duboisii H88]|uniref:U3 small nucleolar RNA-associated protein n=1 Tax=Ajellomyces capsulatus (strain H88) TaxID=544711 RepID=A0A8A1LQ55_AJEC8|nr:U3 small nucleolar RNA-associated protein [Histoplasma capsulatum var. duboisii H88]
MFLGAFLVRPKRAKTDSQQKKKFALVRRLKQHTPRRKEKEILKKAKHSSARFLLAGKGWWFF